MKDKTKKTNPSKGITLIALVITIIVLLILAGITIVTLMGDNGILTKAKNASDEHIKKSAKEQIQIAVFGSLGKDSLLDDETLKKNLNNIEGIEGVPEGDINCPFDVTLDGYIFTIRRDGAVEQDSRPEIKIGDYINYTPDLNEDGSKPSYSSTDLGKDKTGSPKNTEDIEQENLSWQVLRKYEDGRIDIIGTPTSKMIYFAGSIGYNYGVDIMNDVCKTLYSKPSEEITARNVKIEDFEYWLTDEGRKLENFRNFKGVEHGTSKTIICNTNNYFFPALYKYEKGSGIDSATVRMDGLGVSDSVSELTVEQQNDLENSPQKNTNKLTVTHTGYSFPYSDISEKNFGKAFNLIKLEGVLDDDFKYWISSRSVTAVAQDNADFDLFCSIKKRSGLRI